MAAEVETIVQVGKLKLISSGTITFIAQDPISLTVSIPPEQITVLLGLSEQEVTNDLLPIPAPKMDWAILNSTTIRVNVATTRSIGETAMPPTRIGIIGGRQLYLSFSVVFINFVGRLTYSFLHGE